jgi:CheY-like chemotaxis protein
MAHFDKQVFLLAEDSDDQVLLMKKAFQKAGVPNPLQVVNTGEEAVAYLKGQPPFNDRTVYPLPFALLLDLKMAGMDGFEVLQWVRQQPDLKNLIVIMLTASSRASDADLAYDLGADFYLTKPGPLSELVEMTKCLRDWLCVNNFSARAKQLQV